MPPQRRQSWQDVVDIQAHLATWIRSRAGAAWLYSVYTDVTAALREDSREMLIQLYGTEHRRISDADPIFVSEEMVDVVDAAMGRFQPEALLPDDFMTTHGFIYYERPFVVPDRRGGDTHLQGFSWAPYLNETLGKRFIEQAHSLDDPRQAADWLLNELRETADYGNPDATVNGVALTIYGAARGEGPQHLARTAGPPIAPIHITPWFYGMSFDGEHVDENGVATGAEWWWKVVQTTLRLMQQQLSTSDRYRPDKAGRRARVKAGLDDDRDVVVVRLRRAKHAGIEGGPHGEANYSHRFIRNGHWRNQWYPSLGPSSDPRTHRQIYIHSTVVGDPDLPLIIRPNRAFVWTR